MSEPIKRVMLKDVRLSFPDLFVARPFKEGDTPKFKATFLIPKDSPQMAAIRSAILATANEKWPGKGEAIVKSIQGNPNKFCFQDGDTKDYDGYAGMMALTAGSTTRPTILDQERNPLAQADGKPYAGCYVNASVEFFGYTNSGNGISAQLRGVQFVRDGDHFGGGAPADVDEFEPVATPQATGTDPLFG